MKKLLFNLFLSLFAPIIPFMQGDTIDGKIHYFESVGRYLKQVWEN